MPEFKFPVKKIECSKCGESDAPFIAVEFQRFIQRQGAEPQPERMRNIEVFYCSKCGQKIDLPNNNIGLLDEIRKLIPQNYFEMMDGMRSKPQAIKEEKEDKEEKKEKQVKKNEPVQTGK